MPDIKKYLNRDGLDEYNSLLPHSSAEMQTYVNEWMDEHPEASTTVQDGAITERKLADKSVSLRTLADDTVHMLKGMILTGNLSGDVLAAADAYSAPPVAHTIEGKSMQDGTPTPVAPVEIESIEQIELNFAGKNLIQLTDVPATKTQRGLTFTWNGNSLKVTGEQSQTNAQSTAVVIPFCIKLEAGKQYTFSLQGTYQGPTSTTLYMRRNDGTQLIAYASTDAKWTFSPSYDFTIINFALRIGTSIGVVNIDARPMLELGANATPYEPYNAITTLLNLTHALRSLPDGTRDELSFSYLRPSTREEFAWYSSELTQNVGEIGIGNNFDVREIAINADETTSFIVIGEDLIDHTSQHPISNIATLGGPTTSRIAVSDGNIYMRFASDVVGTTKNAIDTYLNEHCILLYHVPTSVVTQLSPVELPILPAPSFTIWSNQNTVLQMEYVRDSNIVIQNIEQAIADL